MTDYEKRLNLFQTANNANTKGPLALLVQITRTIRDKTFPLNADDFLTGNKGQVSGLGGGNLKKILAKHGITQTLAAEGGRTSRGNMGLMIKYVDFLNAWKAENDIDLEKVEAFWANRVQDYFSNQPFTLTADPAKTIGASLDDLFIQAKKREKENPGTHYLGTILQHLVGAKLSLIIPRDSFEIHGTAVADSPTNRSGDFSVNTTVIHCTTAPGEPLIKKCSKNIEAGTFPVIITVYDRVKTALDLAEDAGLTGRVEVWDIQQFLSTNITEHTLFNSANRNTTLNLVIDQYNENVGKTETDPSLRIEFDAK